MRPQTSSPWLGLLSLLVFLTPRVLAQSAAELAAVLPSCAFTCLVTYIEQSTCTTNLTAACLCSNEVLLEEVTECVSANCTVKEALVAQNVTKSTCGTPYHDLGQAYYDTAITLGVISAALIITRFAFKIFALKMVPTADDWCILATIFSGIPSMVITTHGIVPNGLGRDIWNLTPTQITNFLRFFYAMEMLYFLQIALLKLSLLFFYLRIFPARPVRRLLWATIAFTTLYGTVFVIIAIFQCQPISYYWTNWDHEHTGTCMNVNALGWANAGIGIALDVFMLAIPLWQLKSLNLHWRKKIGVGIMFSVGTFVTVVSILRLQSLVTFATSSNATWSNYDVSNWSIIEVNVGIICTCLPVVRQLVIRVFPVLGGTRTGKSSYGPYTRSRDLEGSRAGKSNNRSRSRTIDNFSKNSKITSSSLDEPDAKSRNTTTGTGVSIGVHRNQRFADMKSPGIILQQSYDVKYEDDETSLVALQDLESQAVQKPRSILNNTLSKDFR